MKLIDKCTAHYFFQVKKHVCCVYVVHPISFLNGSHFLRAGPNCLRDRVCTSEQIILCMNHFYS